MRLFLTTIFILNSLIGFCQVDLFFPLKNEFDWKSVEKQNPELMKRFVESKLNELESFRAMYNIYDDDERLLNMLILDEDFHIIDFRECCKKDIFLVSLQKNKLCKK